MPYPCAPPLPTTGTNYLRLRLNPAGWIRVNSPSGGIVLAQEWCQSHAFAGCPSVPQTDMKVTVTGGAFGAGVVIPVNWNGFSYNGSSVVCGGTAPITATVNAAGVGTFVIITVQVAGVGGSTFASALNCANATWGTFPPPIVYGACIGAVSGGSTFFTP